MNTFARFGAAALAVALTFTLAACGGNSDTSTSASNTSAGGATSGTPTAMMSGPMMSGPASAMLSQPAVSGDHSTADLMFAQMMIVHHQGAIEMADLAPNRAASQDIKDLAARIKAAQSPEIEQMQTWLTTWGAAMPGATAATPSDDAMSGMDHGGMPGMTMPGMMSDAQMQELTDAAGVDFDRLFLELMIVHHQGGIEMSETEIAQGSNEAALALAESITTSQTAEIAEMQQLLQTL